MYQPAILALPSIFHNLFFVELPIVMSGGNGGPPGPPGIPMLGKDCLPGGERSGPGIGSDARPA